MTTTHKLWIGFGSLGGVLVLIVGTLLIWLFLLESQVDEITLLAGPMTEAAHEMEINVNGLGMAVANYLHTKNENQKQRALAGIKDFERYRTEYQRLADSGRERQWGRRIDRLFSEYRDLALRLMAQREAGEFDAADLDRFIALRVELDGLLDDEIQAHAITRLDESRQSARSSLQTLLGTALILVILGLVVGGGASIAVGRGVVKTEQTLRVTLASIADAVITTDARGRVVYLNPAAESLTGWPEFEAAGRPLAEVFAIQSEETRTPLNIPAGRLPTEEEAAGLAGEMLLVARSGDESSIDSRLAHVRDPGGDVAGVVAAFRDIGERRRREAMLKAVVDHVADGIITIDQRGVVHSFNPAAERIFGYGSAEMMGENVRMLMPQPYRGEHDGYISNYLRTGEAKIIGIGRQVEGRRKDGATFPLDLAVSGFNLGSRRFFTGVVRDITEERKAELAEAEAQAMSFARDIVHSVREPLIVLDSDLRVQSANRAFYETFHVAPDQTEGRYVYGLGNGQWDIPRLRTLLEEILPRNTSFSDFEVDHVFPAIGRRIMLLNGRRIYRETADTEFILLAIEDFTEQKEAERELAEANEALLQSNSELEQFASVASHDLQEPLRKIQAFGDRLRLKCADAMDERGRDYLERMQQAAARMRRLINDLLSFSRVTTKAQPYEPIDLAALAREAATDLEARIEETGGRVEIGELPTIDADPLQMRQLLMNLMANALKFHQPKRPPIVSVTGRALPPDYTPAFASARGGNAPDAASPPQIEGGWCEIRVRDNGIGFDESYLDRIFDVFQRLHGRLDYEGTGMGLAICRKIVQRHRGEITAESTPGAGSTFIITLPLRQPEDELRDAPAS